ncbi:MAG: rhodanese-like domain-containing protein [Rhodospirillales bacterium]|nr:rhodanese-like domain-containing protein [Rhodospirillales bacterium]MDE2197580.1 rhodanese-like domain-containing protein [Rhodospirillales bacterium]MDE2577026.1 rhodanese-like domain-containing protein [Rhodospirillales bacterium]
MVENIPVQQVWNALATDPAAQLVDVRTDAEWSYVGLTDLSALDKQPVLIAWQIFPAMQVNGDFVAQLKQAGLTPSQPIYFLCRSGVRSLAAAAAAQAAGFPHSYNIEHGFEGPPDGQGHRGRVSGWKAEGLPWRQR